MTFLLLWSLRASGVVAVGLLLALARRGRSAALRNLVLRLTLGVACALPVLATLAPRVEVPLAPPALAPRTAPSIVGRWVATPVPITGGWSVVQSDPKDMGTVGFVRQTPFSTGWTPAATPLLVLWAGGVGLLALRWSIAFGRLRRIARRGETSVVAGLKSGVQVRTEVRAPTTIFADVTVPMTYGWTILLPHDAKAWPEARLRAAILHERAHVARRDWHWQTLAALFAAVHWANPLAWLLARALRDSAEASADDAVLAQGVAPSAYARELLAVAAKVGPTGPALAMARRGGVKDRVVAVLSDRRDRRKPSRAFAATLFAILIVSGVGIAGLAFASTTLVPKETGVSPGSSVLLPGGVRLRLLSVADYSTTPESVWSPEGTRPPEEPATLLRLPRSFPPLFPGERRFGFFFTTTERVSEPSHFSVHAVGSGGFRPVGSDFQALAGGGTAVVVYGDAPATQKTVDLEAQLPAGPWRREADADPAKVVPPLGETVRMNGKAVTLRNVEVRLRKLVRNRWNRLVATDAKGRAVAEAINPGFHEMIVEGAFPTSVPLARIAVESRPIATASFRGVRLRANDTNPAFVSGGRSVELAGVWSPDGTGDPWRADGSKGGPKGVANYDGALPPRTRAMLFAFRLRSRVTAVPTIRVRPAYSGARFEDSKLSLVRDEGDTKLVWIRTVVPEELQASDLDVELGLEFPDPGPILPKGAKKGQVSVEVASVDVRPGVSYAQLRVTPHVPMDLARYWYSVSPVDARGGSPESFGYEEDGPTFRISMAHPERAVAWRVWKSPRERLRFAGVRLRPNS